MRTFVSGVFVGGICAVFLTAASSQQEALDPVVLSPEIYQTLLENDVVRVIQMNVADGIRPATHAHPDRVEILLTECTWVDTADDGTVIEDRFRAGEVIWEEATTHGGQIIRVREPCTVLEVEIK